MHMRNIYGQAAVSFENSDSLTSENTFHEATYVQALGEVFPTYST
jgi:hypothetical protein